MRKVLVGMISILGVSIFGFAGISWQIQADQTGYFSLSGKAQALIPKYSLILFGESITVPYFSNLQAGVGFKIPASTNFYLGPILLRNELGGFASIDLAIPAFEISTSIASGRYNWSYSLSAVTTQTLPWQARFIYKEYHLRKTYLARATGQCSLALCSTQSLVIGGELSKYSYGRGGFTRKSVFAGITFYNAGWKITPLIYSSVYSGKQLLPLPYNPSIGIGLNLSLEF